MATQQMRHLLKEMGRRELGKGIAKGEGKEEQRKNIFYIKYFLIFLSTKI